MRANPIIALLTDFGTADWFVGSMKAAILSRLPGCTVVDLWHGVAPGAVDQAAWLLARTFREFPPATVFCCVVDPGVGTDRRAIAAVGDNGFFVSPDNGLLTGVRRCVAAWQCRAITNKTWMRPEASRTFHGRDVFAPAAAQVALDGGIANAGECIADPVEIELPGATVAPDGSVEGRVVLFDRFGNAVTTIARESAGARGEQVVVGSLTIARLSSTYGDVAPGEVIAYWGSLATVEIAVRGASARERLGLRVGDRVRLRTTP